jgi:hypothetical protein
VHLPINFDLSRLSGPGIAQVLFPLLPGGILVGGAIVLKPDLAKTAQVLPEYWRIIGILVAAYAAGLLLALSVIGVLGGLAAACGQVAGQYFSNKFRSVQPWNSAQWRAVAADFLGPDFAPPREFPLTEEGQRLRRLEIDAKEPDPFKRIQAGVDLVIETSRLRAAEMSWVEWYRVFDVLFGFARQRQAPTVGTYISQAAYASAVAVMILLHFGPVSHPLAWVLCWFTILGAALEYFYGQFIQQFWADATAYQIAAMIEWKLKERAAERAEMQKIQ